MTDAERRGDRLAAMLRGRARQDVAPDPAGLVKASTRHRNRRRAVLLASASVIVVIVCVGVVTAARRHNDHVTTRPAPTVDHPTIAPKTGPQCDFGPSPFTYCGLAMDRIGERTIGSQAYVVYALTCRQIATTTRLNLCGTPLGSFGAVAVGLPPSPQTVEQGLLEAPRDAHAKLYAATGGGPAGPGLSLVSVIVIVRDPSIRTLRATSAQGPTDTAPTWKFGSNRIGLIVLPNDPSGAHTTNVEGSGTNLPSRLVTTPINIQGLRADGHVIAQAKSMIAGIVVNDEYTQPPASLPTCAQQHLADAPMYLGKTEADAQALAASRGETVQVVIRDGKALPAASSPLVANRVVVVVVAGKITNACRE